MSRPRIARRISDPPEMKGFRPYGMVSCVDNSIKFKYEEYESPRLVNYEMLPQDTASKHMNFSRPTFTRIYMTMLQSSPATPEKCI
jgi:predicted DNA-binding protein (UPF0251 family)